MKKKINHSEEELEILRKVEENPNLTQRQIAEKLGLSVGKINYLIQALMDKGFLKIGNFKRSDFGMMYAIKKNLVGDVIELIIEFEARQQ